MRAPFFSGCAAGWTRAAALLVSVAASLTVANSVALATVRTWSGGGATSYWSNTANWVGNAPPVAGDMLLFPNTAANRGSTNDLTTATYASIMVTGTDYVIIGNAIGLSQGIQEDAPSGVAPRLELPIKLTAAQTWTANNDGIRIFGAVNLNGFALTTNTVGGVIQISGAISGAGGLIKNGIDWLGLSGTNTYTGVTQINAGAVRVEKSQVLGATGPGNHTVVASGASIQLSDGVSSPEALTLSGSGIEGDGGALNSYLCFTSCALTGPVTLAGNTLIVTNYPLLIAGAIGESGGARTLTVDGVATLTLAGANTYTGGTTIGMDGLIAPGGLIVTGTIGNVLLDQSGGTLAGTGTVGNIVATGGGTPATIAPGASPGVLNASGTVTLATNTALAIEIGGTTAGTQYDRLNATGAVNLNGASLQASLVNGFVPAPGNQFTIVQSAGTISGQFAQGSSVTISGAPYTIAYNPNGIVLTRVASTTPVLTVSRSGSGAGTVTSVDGFINCGAACTHSYAAGAMVTLNPAPAGGSNFTGWLGTCTGTGACIVTMDAAKTATAGFALNTILAGSRILDIDANNQYDALTDGLMVIRYLFGLDGASVTNTAIGTGAARSSALQVVAYLNDIRPYLDADGNGAVDALTDGLLIIRNLFGLTGTPLIQGAVGAGARRSTATAIDDYLGTLRP
ncbi:MAG: autotransporter-associated beta strand repeat-containing protein [Betaproteobacteria bacterium]